MILIEYHTGIRHIRRVFDDYDVKGINEYLFTLEEYVVEVTKL